MPNMNVTILSNRNKVIGKHHQKDIEYIIKQKLRKAKVNNIDGSQVTIGRGQMKPNKTSTALIKMLLLARLHNLILFLMTHKP